MNKQVLTLGIILSLGTVGCAGFGVQHGSSLSAQLQNEQGLDNLWSSAEREPAEGLQAPLYADQDLGDLWSAENDHRKENETAGGDKGFYANQALGNLWNTAF